MTQWRSVVDVTKEDVNEWVWVASREHGVQLAQVVESYEKKRIAFQAAETVGDSEGLSVEYYDDVVVWSHVKEPELPEFMA